MVYKFQNVDIYNQIFSKSCSGEGEQYSELYAAGMRRSACESFRNKCDKKVKENIT